MQIKVLKKLKYPTFDRRGLMQGSEVLGPGAERNWPPRYAQGQIEAGNVEAATVTPKQPEIEAQTTSGPSLGPAITAPALELAAENNLDLSTVTGTGAGGKITKSDVEAALNG